MKTSLRLVTAAVFGAGILALTAASASAAILCNAAGECWHARHPYAYPAAAGIVIHPDGWVAAPGARVVWREHVGRGYWRNGIWIRF
jgi:hypothetical protein